VLVGCNILFDFYQLPNQSSMITSVWSHFTSMF